MEIGLQSCFVTSVTLAHLWCCVVFCFGLAVFVCFLDGELVLISF